MPNDMPKRVGSQWMPLDNAGKEKTRKALRHAGFCIALVLIGPVFGGLAYYELIH